MIACPEIDRQAAAIALLRRGGDDARTVRLCIKTVSEANRASHEHWRARQGRAKEQREAAYWIMMVDQGAKITDRVRAAIKERRPVVVLLKRVAPSRGLDAGDNLAGSMKHVRDGIAKALLIDDRSPAVTWLYDQRRGPYAVEATFVVEGGGGWWR